MYSIDLGNYQTKVATRDRMDTVTLTDKLYYRYHLSAIREVDDHRYFGSFGRGIQLGLMYELYKAHPSNVKEAIFNIFYLLSHIKREYDLPDHATVVLTTRLSLPLRLIYSTLGSVLFKQTLLVQDEVSVAGRLFLSYYKEVQYAAFLRCLAFSVGEFAVKLIDIYLDKQNVKVVNVDTLAFGAYDWDQIVCKLCGGCVYEKNIEAIKQCRKVLSLNETARVYLLEHDAEVSKTAYLAECEYMIVYMHRLLAFRYYQSSSSVFEAVGGAARDAACTEAMRRVGIEQYRRLNWEESEASGALIYGSLGAKLNFATILDVPITAVLVYNGIEVYSLKLAAARLQVPTTFKTHFQLKQHMHVKLVAGVFLLRVYYFKGAFPRQVYATCKIELSGDVFIVSDYLEEIFNYAEKPLLDEIVAREKQLYGKDCAWLYRNGGM